MSILVLFNAGCLYIGNCTAAVLELSKLQKLLLDGTTTSQLRHNYVTTTSQLRHNYVTTTSQLRHNYVTTTSQLRRSAVSDREVLGLATQSMSKSTPPTVTAAPISDCSFTLRLRLV